MPSDTKRDAYQTVTLSPKEKRAVQRAAQATRMTTSAWCRKAIMDALDKANAPSEAA
jgi:hypothetical protein